MDDSEGTFKDIGSFSIKMSRREKDQWLDEKDKREGRRSLYYFGKYILGFDLEENPHREVCDFVQNAGPLALALLPRGSYKTTIVSHIYPVWRLIDNPNIRILLDSVILRNSERNLDVIKNILEQNERLKYLFGDHYNSKKWTQSAITSKLRTMYRLKDPTIGTSSVENMEIGSHWDLIIPDDLHNEHNTKNRDQIDKVYEHLKLSFSLLEPGGMMRMVGTRWADLDLYGRIIERHKNWQVMERWAIHPDKLQMLKDKDSVIEDKYLFFPGRLNKAALFDILDMEGSEMFSAQYQNDPMPAGESARFKKSWFKYGEDKDIPLYMTVDPSIGATPDSDFFAIVIGGINRNNDLFIENYIYGRWQPFEAIDKMFLMFDKYRDRLRAIGIEVNAFQRMLKFAFDVEMKKRGKFITIIELRHNKAKEDRILSLNPRYEAGAVYHREWMRDHEMEEELIKFPKGRRDDLIDAEAALLEIIPAKRPPRKIVTVERDKNWDMMTEIARGYRKYKGKIARHVGETPWVR